MKNSKDINLLHEQKVITMCIMKGMTLKQIALKLDCAKSSASYKTRKLFKEWNAADRHEFVVNIFAKIIEKYKREIAKLREQINNTK